MGRGYRSDLEDLSMPSLSQEGDIHVDHGAIDPHFCLMTLVHTLRVCIVQRSHACAYLATLARSSRYLLSTAVARGIYK